MMIVEMTPRREEERTHERLVSVNARNIIPTAAGTNATDVCMPPRNCSTNRGGR